MVVGNADRGASHIGGVSAQVSAATMAIVARPLQIHVRWRVRPGRREGAKASTLRSRTWGLLSRLHLAHSAVQTSRAMLVTADHRE